MNVGLRLDEAKVRRGPDPLLDRIDIHVEVPRVEYEKLASDRLAEPSSAIRERVERARERQRQRFRGTKLSARTPRWAQRRSASTAGSVPRLGAS
jgi:predicted ATPase with chaperone activity